MARDAIARGHHGHRRAPDRAPLTPRASERARQNASLHLEPQSFMNRRPTVSYALCMLYDVAMRYAMLLLCLMLNAMSYEVLARSAISPLNA